MIVQEHTLLWEKIKNFSIDDHHAALPFSAKLAQSEKWSILFTQRAITEYRKFILLCCILPEGAAPSNAVDQVWHLHLTYTRSYWIDFCRNTLEKEIHHYPSAGGKEEVIKHCKWYAETLKSYRAVFGADPPPDIWPADMKETPVFAKPFFPSAPIIFISAILLAAPFLFIWKQYKTTSPFSISGPHFLIFFPIFGLALIVIYVFYQLQISRHLTQIVSDYFPENSSAFQVAHFLYGKHRALQAAIVDLIKQQRLELAPGNRFLVNRSKQLITSEEDNPLVPTLEDVPDGSSHSYEELMGNWYDRSKFEHPALQTLKQFACQRGNFFLTYGCQLLFVALSVTRMVQGTINNRPIGSLVAETVILGIPFLLLTKFFSRRYQVYRKVIRLYKARIKQQNEKDTTITQYVFKGPAAITGFAEGATLLALFSLYPPRGLDSGLVSWSSESSNCSSGGSCSGSGCSSSCGGCSGN